MQSNKKSSLLSAIFLVCGTSIGAGMLAQPVAASTIGFIPATVMMGLAWVFMTSTALLLLEVTLWMKHETHIISMAKEFLGLKGQVVAWICYVFIAYGSLTAYVSGGAEIFSKAIFSVMGVDIPNFLACSIFALVFGAVIEFGHKAVGKLNAILFTGLVASYGLIVVLGSQGISLENLSVTRWEKSFMIIPLLFTSFSFQMIIPSLANYLDRDAKRLRISIIGGTLASFFIYLIWNSIVLGALPPDAGESLLQAYAEGRPPMHILDGHASQWFLIAVKYFSFFAIVTSFIGIAWGLFDFLADGLKIKKVGVNRLMIWALVIVPVIILGACYPRAFIGALEATGGYGDSILNGIIPIAMFYVGVNYMKKPTNLILLRKEACLFGLLVFAFLIITLETIHKFGILSLAF